MPEPTPAPAAAAAPDAPDPPALAFVPEELRRSLLRPDAVLAIVLAERARLVASVAERAHLRLLASLLVFSSIVFTVPFALVRAPAKAADIAALFLGSTLLCFPSLQVFTSYLAIRLTVAQNLVLALTVPAAAALFTFGFFPIYWFLDTTM